MKSMNGAARRALAGIREFTVAQRTLAIIGVLVLVLGGAALSVWLGQPTYSPLFSGLSSSDASGVVAQLQKDKVDYQLADGGATVLVPVADVDQERLAAASAGLPSASTGGYSLLDNLGVTASEFQENVTYQRAIEGEIAKTIESIDGVRMASVHLAIPKQSVFTETTADPTASVFVDTLTPLSTDQVQAIVHLTSSAVDGLKDADVTVVDSKGDLLSSVAGTASGSTAEQTTDYETRVRTQVQSMLDAMLGPGNSTVTVAADISAATGETTTQSYGVPTQAPVLSESTQKSSYKGSGASGAATMGSDGTTTSTTSSGSPNDTYTSSSSTKNNAVDKTTETKTIPAGVLQRQTIAVAVNSDKVTKISTATIQQLVSAAAGVSAARGDQVTVAAASFSNAAAAGAKAALDQAATAQSTSDMTQLITTGIQVAGGLIALVIVIIVLRKLFKKPDQVTIDAGDLNVYPLTPQPDAALQAAQLAAHAPGGWPLAAMPAGPFGGPFGAAAEAETVPIAQRPPHAAAARPDSPFGRMQNDVDALAEADPEATADYLRALMADRQDA